MNWNEYLMYFGLCRWCWMIFNIIVLKSCIQWIISDIVSGFNINVLRMIVNVNKKLSVVDEQRFWSYKRLLGMLNWTERKLLSWRTIHLLLDMIRVGSGFFEGKSSRAGEWKENNWDWKLEASRKNYTAISDSNKVTFWTVKWSRYNSSGFSEGKCSRAGGKWKENNWDGKLEA